jgi:hypothetical protein
MTIRNKISLGFAAVVVALLLLVPVYASLAGEPFALTFMAVCWCLRWRLSA